MQKIVIIMILMSLIPNWNSINLSFSDYLSVEMVVIIAIRIIVVLPEN